MGKGKISRNVCYRTEYSLYMGKWSLSARRNFGNTACQKQHLTGWWGQYATTNRTFREGPQGFYPPQERVVADRWWRDTQMTTDRMSRQRRGKKWNWEQTLARMDRVISGDSRFPDRNVCTFVCLFVCCLRAALNTDYHARLASTLLLGSTPNPKHFSEKNYIHVVFS